MDLVKAMVWVVIDACRGDIKGIYSSEVIADARVRELGKDYYCQEMEVQ